MKKICKPNDSRTFLKTVKNKLVVIILLCLTIIPSWVCAQGKAFSTPAWNSEKIIQVDQASNVIIHVENAVIGQSYKLKNMTDGTMVQTVVAKKKVFDFDPLTFRSVSAGTTLKYIVYDVDLNLETKFTINVNSQQSFPSPSIKK